MISVVTPCYNAINDGRLEFFIRMMESVHRQSYRNIEHIVVNNNSDDGTTEFLREYQRIGWISTLVDERKQGIYPAMNTGVRLAKGEYVNIMNTDDYFTDQEFFRQSIDAIEENSVDFTHANRVIKSREGKPNVIKKGDERTAYFRMPFRHQTMIVKKEVFDEVGLFDETYKIAADYKWILSMLMAGKKGHYIPRVFVSSLDGGASSNRQGCIEEVTRVLFESYGMDNGLSQDDCRRIYLREPSVILAAKVLTHVRDPKIRNSVMYGLYLGLKERIRKDKKVKK